MLVPGQPRGKKGKQFLCVSSHSLLDVGKVAMDTPHYSNMFSVINKLDISVVDVDGGDGFLVVHGKFLPEGGEGHQLGLFWSQNDMVGGTVVQSQSKEMIEQCDVCGEQNNIICLANRRDFCNFKVHAETSISGDGQLVSIVHGVKVSRGDSTLLEALLIIDGPKNPVVPLDEGLPVLKAVVKVKESLSSSPDMVEFFDDYFPDCEIESGACI